MDNYKIIPLKQEHIVVIAKAFAQIQWNKPAQLFEMYLQEQVMGERFTWVAFDNGEFLGYITLKLKSDYEHFSKLSIPEIKDLNVLPSHRNKGIGSNLLDIAEGAAYVSHKYVGIGVGLYADYGAAQRLYIKRGYIPDGKGVTYNYMPVVPGGKYPVDDDLVLWFIKNRPQPGR